MTHKYTFFLVVTTLLFSFFIAIPAYAQNVPTFGALGPCPSCETPSMPPVQDSTISPPVNATTNSTYNSIPGAPNAPCDPNAAPEKSKKSKHKKHDGAISKGMGELLELLVKFFQLLLELLGGGSGSLPKQNSLPNQDSQPNQDPLPNPTSPADPVDPVDSGPLPCPPADSNNTTTNSTANPVSQTPQNTQPSQPQTSGQPQPSGGVPSAGGQTGVPGQQKLGCGGVATPPGATLTTADSGAAFTISQGGTPEKWKVYDGQCKTVGAITIRANYVVVQNFLVRAKKNLGIGIGGTTVDAKVHHVVVQNNDIKDIMAPGDLNVMEMFGDNIVIAYNTAIDAITGDAGGSHTDFVQTWNTKAGMQTTNVIIVGNRATGEPDDAKESVNTHYNQAVIGEGAGCSAGGGGSGASSNWFVSDNYFTADSKFCAIDNVTYTRNTFAGIDKRHVVIQDGSAGFKYFSDNKVADGGRTTAEIGAPVIPGPGPAAPNWMGKGGNFSGGTVNP